MDYDSMSYNPNRQGSYSAPNGGGGGGGGYLADFDPEGPAAPASAQQVRVFAKLSENREKTGLFSILCRLPHLRGGEAAARRR